VQEERRKADLRDYVVFIPADDLYPEGWFLLLRRADRGLEVAVVGSLPEEAREQMDFVLVSSDTVYLDPRALWREYEAFVSGKRRGEFPAADAG